MFAAPGPLNDISGMRMVHDIRRRRLARAVAVPVPPHPWCRDAAADLRHRLVNYRRSLPVAVTPEDRSGLLEQIAAAERALASLGR